MRTQTLVVEIPEGFELKYDIVKVKPLGKKGRPVSNLANDPNSKSRHIRNRERVAEYNREYYKRKKAEKQAEKERHILVDVTE